MDGQLQRRIRTAALSDVYGTLLTDRQRRIIDLYHDQDLSLAEIADDIGVSRQAVHDALERAQTALEEYERRLGFYAWQQRLQTLIEQIKLSPHNHNELIRQLEREVTTIRSDSDV